MESREIVRKAIEFDTPPRLPFFLGGLWSDRLSAVIEGFPNDVCDCWEAEVMFRAFYELKEHWAPGTLAPVSS